MAKTLGMFSLLCFANASAFAQSPGDVFEMKNANLRYLEELTKAGVDAVRQQHGSAALANDSILYLAASDHANYLKRTGELSHFQNKNARKADPQKRAEYYGAINYNVGENAGTITVGTYIISRKGERLPVRTYEEIAAALVVGWVDSKRHFDNMTLRSFELTGLAISFDPKDNKVIAVQKFASVQ